MSSASSIGAYITAMRWVDEPVIAAGHLRQGRAIELLLPRRCRLLPRQFVLAVTARRVVAFKAWSEGQGAAYAIGIKPGIRVSFPRDDVELLDVRANGAMMRVGDERFPVTRPNRDGDPDTDELIALLGGLPPLKAPQEPAWAAFSL